MFGAGIRIFRIAGFDVRIDFSWVFLVLLVAWTLATGVFPEYYSGWPRAHYWTTAIAGVVGLFLSIVLHELAHSLVARAHGTPMGGITLFIFGGVAQMEREPRNPQAELTMAIAGPLTSLALAGFFGLVYVISRGLSLPEPITALGHYLGLLNLALALFNLVPAFPMDGGRALRAYLWAQRGDYRSATRTAAAFGAAFGAVLVALGLFSAIAGDLVMGLWWFLIGMFIRNAARMSSRDVEVRRLLGGLTVSRLMDTEPITVPPAITLAELADTKIMQAHVGLFPVVEGGRLLGCIGVREIQRTPKAQWPTMTAGLAMAPCAPGNSIAADAPAIDALRDMQMHGQTWLIVTQGGDLAGLLSLPDMLHVLALRMELEGDD